MKNYTFILSCILFLTTFSHLGFSQNLQGNQNISAGIGIASWAKLGDYPDDEFDFIILKDPIVQYRVSTVNRSYLPTFHISYSYGLSKKITLGILGAYEKSSGDFKQDNEFVGSFNHQYFTVAMEGKYLYLDHSNYSIYASFGLGCLIYSQNDKFPQASTSINSKDYNLNGFISPIGIRVGKKLGGFLEVGYGYKGILNTGISYRM